MNRAAIRMMAMVLALSLSAAQALPAQKPAMDASPIEIAISGPRLIRRGDTLRFKVTLMNRSSKPVAVRMPHDVMEAASRIEWRITDAGGRLLPPYVYDGPPLFYCPVTSPPSDLGISILQPGEKIAYDDAGDPSDLFVFHGKGFYRVTLTYVFSPASYVIVAGYRPPDEKPESYTPQQKVDMLKAMPSFTATSNVWQMYLTD